MKVQIFQQTTAAQSVLSMFRQYTLFIYTLSVNYSFIVFPIFQIALKFIKLQLIITAANKIYIYYFRFFKMNKKIFFISSFILFFHAIIKMRIDQYPIKRFLMKYIYQVTKQLVKENCFIRLAFHQGTLVEPLMPILLLATILEMLDSLNYG